MVEVRGGDSKTTPDYRRGMRWILGVTIAVGCAKEADLEARIGKLEREVVELRSPNSPPVDVNWSNMPKPIVEALGSINRQLSAHESQLSRADSLMTIKSTVGWWCGAGGCGRTPRECASHSTRAVMSEGPSATGAECEFQRHAWCDDKFALSRCYQAKCAKCVEVE